MRAKKVLSVILAALLALPAVPVYGAAKAIPTLSPAIAVLSSGLRLDKSGLAGSEVEFDTSDFDSVIGASVPSVTLLTLPASGSLKLGEEVLSAGRTLDRRELSELTFAPVSGLVTEASFRMGIVGNEAYCCDCRIYILPVLNFAPTSDIGDDTFLEASTYCGVSYFGTLHACDPEGDALTFEIVSYPKNGTLNTDKLSAGEYEYLPQPGKTGSDSFEYIARDCYGNRTEKTRVVISVERPDDALAFCDMEQCDALSSAMKTVDGGVLQARSDTDGIYFDPDGEVSRAEFISALYRAAGLRTDVQGSTAVFSDIDAVSEVEKRCILDAYGRGIIAVSPTDSGLVFSPESPVTRLEAAAVTAAAIGISDTPAVGARLSDASSVAPEYTGAVMSLCGAGIFRTKDGEFRPEATLTRADAAQLLDGVMRYTAR